jgi:hypothetical protein
MYSLQTLHINMSYVFSDAQIDGTLLKELEIRHVYMKGLKRIHRTCVYEEFEEST